MGGLHRASCVVCCFVGLWPLPCAPSCRAARALAFLPVLASTPACVNTSKANGPGPGHVRVLAWSAKSHLKYSAKGAQVRKKAPAASRQRLRRWGVISGVVAGTCSEWGEGGISVLSTCFIYPVGTPDTGSPLAALPALLCGCC